MGTGRPGVIVVGNGPVGQTTALLLARWGIPVVLLDRRAQRDLTGSRAICQQRDVLDIWDAVGAGAAIAAAGLTWRTARTYYRDNELFAVQYLDKGRSPFPPWVNISQSQTEAILDEQIRAQPLIDVRWRHDVIDLSQEGHEVRVACRTTSDHVVLRAPYVVACTGSRSALVDRLGITFDDEAFEDRFLICDIRADLGTWASERRFYFDPTWNPGRQVLIHPCPDSTYRIDWQVPADFDLDAEARDGRLDDRIRRIVGDAQYEIVWRSVYRFSSRLADRFRAGRVLLAGDCAHLFAPFGARGLNSGVQDAENAAWKLAFVLRGWAGDVLLDSYDAERRSAALENLAVVNATMRFLVPQTPQERSTRVSVLDRSDTDPEARALVDSGRLAEPFWYVTSPLTTPAPSRPFSGRPPKGEVASPGPGILAPDVPIAVAGRPEVTRMRQLARDGLLLLVADGVDVSMVSRRARAITDAPLNVFRVAEVDVDGAVASTYDVRDREVWLLRPDAHIAAVLVRPSHAQLTAAIRRCLGAQVGPR